MVPAVRKVALVLGAILVAFFTVGLFSIGCASVRPACQTIDTLHKACTVLVFADRTGHEQRVTVAADELAAFGETTLAARGPTLDAGAPPR